MSKAVYAKIWMSTRFFNLRRRYGCIQVCNENKKLLTFGIWKENDVGYNKCAPQPYD
ncbi:hypothetical protein AK88_02464 [Plasmodium fragile]|uniref:Uncharacterized protein n=1 Tax=Plasmodium fragile TaxID=5857 RepID=A0A0D9QLB8_PLAFR|nr:uncharacterized protein AK88_02464 [Plasmodium fragile]KJP87860.1 hypothetical protein AK88_02464 [Plasmodium fragile]